MRIGVMELVTKKAYKLGKIRTSKKSTTRIVPIDGYTPVNEKAYKIGKVGKDKKVVTLANKETATYEYVRYGLVLPSKLEPDFANKHVNIYRSGGALLLMPTNQ